MRQADGVAHAHVSLCVGAIAPRLGRYLAPIARAVRVETALAERATALAKGKVLARDGGCLLPVICRKFNHNTVVRGSGSVVSGQYWYQYQYKY